MMRTVVEGRTKRLVYIPVALAVTILCLASSAGAQNPILYTTQTNPSAPGVSAPRQ